MNDVISKQEAIDALENIFNRCEEIKWHLQDGDTDKDDYKMYPDYLTVWKYLNQDENHGVDTAPVVRCKDCVWWDFFPSSSATPMYHTCRRFCRNFDTLAYDFCSRGELEYSDETD